jgi:hypothetical protein
MMNVKHGEKTYELVKDITLLTLADSEACISGIAKFLRDIPLHEVTTVHAHHMQCTFCQNMLDRISDDENTFCWLLSKGFFKEFIE